MDRNLPKLNGCDRRTDKRTTGDVFREMDGCLLSRMIPKNPVETYVILRYPLRLLRGGNWYVKEREKG